MHRRAFLLKTALVSSRQRSAFTLSLGWWLETDC